MLESLSQVAAILLVERGDAAAELARLPARRQRREVPQAGRAGRSAAAGNLAGKAARLPRARASDGLSRRPDRGRVRVAARPRGRPHGDPSDGHRASIRLRGRGHRPSVRTPRSAPTSASARTAASAPPRSSTAGPRLATTPRFFRSPRSVRFPRISSSRARKRGSSSASGISFASSSPSTAAPAGAAASPQIGDRNVFMAYVHVAHDCHVGRRHDLRPACDAGRPRDRGGLRQHQRRFGGPSVLPRRPPRRSSAATRSSPRTRCRSARPSAAGRRGSSASTPSGSCAGDSRPRSSRS